MMIHPIRRLYRAYLYRGHRRECPKCGMTMAHDGPRRSWCIHCGTIGR